MSADSTENTEFAQKIQERLDAFNEEMQENASLGEFMYFLKRYNHENVQIEAGPAYKTPEGKEVIIVSGSFYPDRQKKIYEYPSGKESSDDGWMID